MHEAKTFIAFSSWNWCSAMLTMYYWMIVFYICVGWTHSMSVKDPVPEDRKETHIYNATNLLYEYFLLCGADYFCHPEKIGFESKDIRTRHLDICGACKCDRDCMINGNCCVDVIFTLPLPVCVSPFVNLGLPFPPDKVFIINSCPINTDKNLTKQCTATEIIFKPGHVEYPLVTSKHYRQTFKNRFCAECNGVFDYNDWSLSVYCPEFTDFNFLSTFDDILEKADWFGCGVGFGTVDEDINYCVEDYVGTREISKCNRTGTWATYDHDIDMACNSEYEVGYGFYDNIFCFMCNPPHFEGHDIITTCNVTGLWDIRSEAIEHACRSHDQSKTTGPYKNVFCFICNRNNSHTTLYMDVYINEMSQNRLYENGKPVFLYSFSIDSYNLEFYNTLTDSENKDNIPEDEDTADWSVNVTKLSDWSVNVTKLLLYDYSVTGHYRYCQKNVTPYIVGQSQCSCSPSCFFDVALECCLDLVLEFPLSCQRPLLATEGPSHYLIDGCYKSSWTDVFQTRCRYSEDDIYSTLPVVGGLGLLYKSFDCFLCNQDNDLSNTGYVTNAAYGYLPWSVDIQCKTDLNLQFHATFYDIVDAAKRHRCDIEITNSEIEQDKSCRDFYVSKLSKQCNTTGGWEESDEDIQWAYWRSDVGGVILQDHLFSPFVSKLVTGEVEVNGSHVFDPITSRPRLLACYPGKIVSGDECIPLLRTTTRLKYTMALSMEGTISTADQAKDLFTDAREEILSEIETKLDFKGIHVESFHIMSNVSCSVLNMTSPIAYHLMVQTTFIILDVIERLPSEIALLNLTKDDLMISNVSFRSRPSNEAYFLPSAHGSNFDDFCYQKSQYQNKLWEALSDIRATLVSDIIICRHVVLDRDEYNIQLETRELSVKYSSRKFHQDKYVRMPDDKVHVCLDDYDDIISEYMARPSHDPLRDVLSITTLACTVISLFCLFLTLITYSLFRTLRSVPGVNNMNLVFAMFFSQGLFQFGLERTSNPTLCMSVGVLTHYFWLVTFTCMNVCSYHMYSVFAINTLTGRSRNIRKRIALYMLYSYGIPMLVIAANIITTYVISAGDDVTSGLADIGYGGDICFISKPISFYAAFLAPVITICVINMLLFVVVAIKIKATPKVDSTKDHRLDVVIYLKLFTITGVTWILIIVDTLFPLSAFSFIVTILTGCQGLFVFFSFVCNQRVLKLYRKLFCKTKFQSRPSTKYSNRSEETETNSI
ncbi:uncharacterized protein [Argopecten irradians]|uniref:uncharacterized protein n=1 Tax=Argopecten irradians TaxID=31199 RepID=UPI0037117789